MKKSLLFATLSATIFTMSAIADVVTLECKKDSRASDGPLLTYTLLKNTQKKTFTLVEESSVFSFMTRKEEKNRDVLAEGLKCEMAASLTFKCSKDLRPVDGALTEFTLSQNAETKKYSLVHASSHYNMMTGKEVSKTETLATGLSCSK